ncbi:MAG: LysM peptidoglycan-binding domain-containing protein [Lentisphaeria bacterium]|nr:LysM peptidoglycan-binding domain-containing protein [Lentisphaeria bacterium]
MTKHLILAITGATLVFCAAGCRHTRIASSPLSQEEAAWQAIIRESYPNYNPPPKTSRSVKGHTEGRTSAVINTPRPMDSAVSQDNGEEVKPEVVETPAEKPAEPAAVETPAEKPAEPAAAETPAEKPAEPAADEGKAVPPDPTNSSVYEVKAGDTLGSIAQKSYGNARFSDVIFKANSDILKDPHTLRPGMKLIVPKL